MKSPPKVAYSIDDVRSWSPKDAAVTLGVFDGVHLGHKRIIADLVESKKAGSIGEAYLITFDPHPLAITHSKMRPPTLSVLKERVHLLKQFDLDGVLVLHFDHDLANVDYRIFIQKYLLQLFNMKRLVLGYDCYFGKNREGSPDRVKDESSRMGFECKIVPVVRNNSQAISSTKIRNALMEGDVPLANKLLGHSYLIAGEIVRGHGMGQGLGFPTANLSVADPYKLWPPGGVYAVEVRRGDQELRGMMNVGRAPTMKSLAEDAKGIEVHLFDFDEDIYGEELWVSCHTYLREERQFPSAEALVEQLKLDKAQALESLAKTSRKGVYDL
jgi:riboflavin kinase/FMN adenylyltransferase